MSFIQLETARLWLRPFTLDDVGDLHQLWTDPDVRRYLWDDEVISRERAAAIIDESIASFEKNSYGLWGVFPRENDALVGFGGFWHFHQPPRLQILYGMAPAYWNRGLATEVALVLIRYGFEQLSFDRIEASTDAPNKASVRVMEKAGMKFEKRSCVQGFDTLFYSISRDRYRAWKRASVSGN
jgi:ribosomal-protein-alanine N-acetyltransferase